ncbi:MAG: Polysaccharide deacetylase family protein [Candidatus Amesbacteria bacterium GW2011_GWA1_47_16]|uniref:Polysaccharide deacetylase family protein n=2 Tax=Candidatus Amesiibacteriota TaxID=1752730 RepID=A0A0G1V347_9BACT|nr:MAG: Polysaccharide deacetylase family protein [Candidatus Amesbacteria bacterium GW2011_GWC1_47_15]KKU64545.1 MAG: Polysaccharide deacetylase family protein [Candidatus Amesbacteria bacterium GW2011_GWA1_47_16]
MKIWLFLRNILFCILYGFDLLLGRRPGVVVLCYHSIGADWRFSSLPGEFRRQVGYLLKNFRIIDFTDLANHLSGKINISGPAFLLTFDDGYRDILSEKNFLDNRGVRPVSFVLSQAGKADRRQLENSLPLLSVGQLKYLVKSGWVIGSHGATHADFNRLTPVQLIEETSGSKKTLEKSLAVRLVAFAYPKGRRGPGVLDYVRRSGYKYAFTVKAGYIVPGMDPWDLPRIGVDSTHRGWLFQAAFSPSVVKLRQLLERMI